MKSTRFSSSHGNLSDDKVNEWLSELGKSLKAAHEFEVEFKSRRVDWDYEKIRDVINYLSPTRSVSKIGKLGVCEVKFDGSLRSGIEIPTVARKVDFDVLRNQFQGIIDALNRFDVQIHRTCGGHIHILSAYSPSTDWSGDHNIKDIMEPVPGVILSNIWQVFRYYLPAFYWISSSIFEDSPDSKLITRGSRYRRWKPISRYSGVLSSVRDITTKPDYDRYCGLNFRNTKWFSYDSSDAEIFHIEHRYPDGNLSASAIAALCCLAAALVMKAVKLSRWGTVTSGTSRRRERNKKLMESLFHGIYEESDDDDYLNQQSILENEKFRREYVNMASELVDFLATEIDYFSPKGDAFNILKSMAKTPVSMMQYNGMNWDEIEKHFRSLSTIDFNEGLEKVAQSIDMVACTNAKSLLDWCDSIGKMLNMSPEQVRESLAVINATFDARRGCVTRTA